MSGEEEKNLEATEIQAPKGSTEAEPSASADAAAEMPAPVKFWMKKPFIFGGGALILALLVVAALLAFGGGSTSEEPQDQTAQQVADEPQAEEPPTAELSEAPVDAPGAEQISSRESAPQRAAEPETQPHYAEPQLAPEPQADPVEEWSEDPYAEFDVDNIDLEADQTVIEEIMSSLEFLDYDPGELEVEGSAGMSVDDSLEQVNWLDQEKTRLSTWESDLKERERKLEKLDGVVSRKLLTLEQAEAARVNTLAKLYDGMDSRAVVKLLANLDDETVVSILPRMKTKSASAVLSLMPPQRAARLSKKMITIEAAKSIQKD